MKIDRCALGMGLVAAMVAMAAWAHSPICNCYDNGDDTVTCEGGFSDGSSAEGVAIRVLDPRDRVLIDGKMDDEGTFTFMRPDEEFHVVFDAGQSHQVMVYAEDIE